MGPKMRGSADEVAPTDPRETDVSNSNAKMAPAALRLFSQLLLGLFPSSKNQWAVLSVVRVSSKTPRLLEPHSGFLNNATLLMIVTTIGRID